MKHKRLSTILLLLLLFASVARAQTFKFAFVSDTHINSGSPTAAEDLRRTVKDINNNPELKFVVITGDITEFGADDELKQAKKILDSLNKKWYIIPGNHDSNWSESGSNTFRKVFGSETFALTMGDISLQGPAPARICVWDRARCPGKILYGLIRYWIVPGRKPL